MVLFRDKQKGSLGDFVVSISYRLFTPIPLALIVDLSSFELNLFALQENAKTTTA